MTDKTTDKSETKTAGDIYTDKRFFTDKPLIKMKNDFVCYRIMLFVEKSKSEIKKRVILILVSDF